MNVRPNSHLKIKDSDLSTGRLLLGEDGLVWNVSAAYHSKVMCPPFGSFLMISWRAICHLTVTARDRISSRSNPRTDSTCTFVQFDLFLFVVSPQFHNHIVFICDIGYTKLLVFPLFSMNVGEVNYFSTLMLLLHCISRIYPGPSLQA